MRDFIAAIRQAVKDENHHAALALALALPDMCGAIAYPEMRAGDRYRCWWARYMESAYTFVFEDQIRLLLGGSDAWALRCAYLHLGSDSIEKQVAAEALSKFRFVHNRSGISHLISTGRLLQLEVSHFCEDVATGGERFTHEARTCQEWQDQIASLMKIEVID